MWQQFLYTEIHNRPQGYNDAVPSEANRGNMPSTFPEARMDWRLTAYAAQRSDRYVFQEIIQHLYSR